jgi:hypothetical protein
MRQRHTGFQLWKLQTTRNARYHGARGAGTSRSRSRENENERSISIDCYFVVTAETLLAFLFSFSFRCPTVFMLPTDPG